MRLCRWRGNRLYLLRGEFMTLFNQGLQKQLMSYDKGFLGKIFWIVTSQWRFTCNLGAGGILRRGNGVTQQLVGLRGQPRSRASFPAVEGLYAIHDRRQQRRDPNNVPPIIANGANWYRQYGTEKVRH